MNSYYDTFPYCCMSGVQLRQGLKPAYPATGVPMMLPSYPGSALAPQMTQMPALPSSMPTGPSTGLIPMVVPSDIGGSLASPTMESTQYIPGFLKTQIGKRVRIEFLIGTNAPLVDRTGTLLGVGASYILIRPTDSDDLELCDLFAIKFVTFYL